MNGSAAAITAKSRELSQKQTEKTFNSTASTALIYLIPLPSHPAITFGTAQSSARLL